MVLLLPPLCIVELTTSAVRLQHVIYETLEDFAAYTYHGKTLRWNTVKNNVVHSDYNELPPCLRVSPAHLISSGSTC